MTIKVTSSPLGYIHSDDARHSLHDKRVFSPKVQVRKLLEKRKNIFRKTYYEELNRINVIPNINREGHSWAL